MSNSVYTTKQVADALALSTSSVRKYRSELEAAGKTFVKTEAGARLFDELDLKTLQHMQRAISKGAKYAEAAEQAVKAVNMHAVMTQEEAPQQVSNDELQAVMSALVNEVRQLRGEVRFLKQAELDRQHEEALRIEMDAQTASNEEKVSPEPIEKPEPKRRGLFERIFNRN